MKSKMTIIVFIILLLLISNPLGYKEHLIYFIVFYFGGGVKIIYCLANMKPYVLDIVKSYEDTIIYFLSNSRTTDLLLNIVICWYAPALRNEKIDHYLCSYLSVLLSSRVYSNKTQTFINPLGYKEHVIYFIVFYFGGGVKIIYWLANMKPYVLGMMKSYEDTIIYYLGNFSTTDLLLNIAQCW